MADREGFCAALETWFRSEGRDYPWRRTRDPYAVWVSELMLQQTRLATVLEGGYYERWMRALPDIARLAAAGEDEVLGLWQGLGYYGRARSMLAAARRIMERHGGVFPRDRDELMALPGVGEYTAAAVMSFAFGEARALVDGNVERVMARLFDYRRRVDDAAGRRQIWAWAGELVAACGDPAAYNSALMELGQTLCVRGQPACGRCPVKGYCLAASPGELPLRRARAAVEEVDEAVIYVRQGGGLWLEQELGTRRRGLWKLPAAGGAGELGPELMSVGYSITRYRVRLRVYGAGAGWRASAGLRWVAEGELDGLALGAPYRRVIRELAEKLSEM